MGGNKRGRHALNFSHYLSPAAGGAAVGRMLGGVQSVLLFQTWHDEVFFVIQSMPVPSMSDATQIRLKIICQ